MKQIRFWEKPRKPKFRIWPFGFGSVPVFINRNQTEIRFPHIPNSWPIQPDILSPPLLRLTSRKPLWLDLQPVDIKSRWRHNRKSAQVVNSHLVCDPTIWKLGFDLPRQQWSLLNRFRTEQGHCGACRRKWRLTDTDLYPCGETQTMSHIVEFCPLTKLNGGLFQLHSADEDAVSWLTSYGSWHAYEKKIGILPWHLVCKN